MKTFLVFLYLLIPIWADAQTNSKIRLSPNANLANSYILLNVLREECNADSLLSWINEEKWYDRKKSLTMHVTRGTSARLNPTVSLRCRGLFFC